MSKEKVANSGQSDEVRTTNCYPYVFPVSATHLEFPNSAKAFEAVGMPVGCLATIFIPNADRSQLYFDSATKIARCAGCGGYLNPYCDATAQRWYCSLCGTRNNITRSMGRYKQIDLRVLPESTEVVLDFPMPYRDIDGAPPAYVGEMGVVAPERPLVHVFLVQENMPIDAMQAVVEALTAAFNAMHPEIQIVLLTFSNRIGIHRLSEQPGETAHTVQYVHMGNMEGEGGIFEGHDLQGAISNSDSGTAAAPSSSTVGGAGLTGVATTMPLSLASDFLSLACPIGACKESAVAALSSLFDPVYSAESVGPGAGFDRNSFETAAVPQVMIGPVLEAVQSWITDADDSEDLNPWEEAEAARRSAVAASEASSSLATNRGRESIGSELFGMLRNIGMGLIGGEIEDDSELDFVTGVRRRKRGGSLSQASSGMTTTADGTDNEGKSTVYERGAIDFCSGVILHLFVSSPQDLPAGSHDSVGYPLPLGDAQQSGSETPLTAPPIDVAWSQAFARKCGLRSLCVNLWSVCSFEGQGVGLQQLAPLANLTGGTINRCILGAFPRDQRARLTEMLVRSVTKQYACKAVLKMRTSTGVEMEGDCPTGPLCPDPELPGIGRIAACSPEATFGFNFTYKSDSSSSLESRGGAVVAQIAFSYETLVETAHILPESSSNGNTQGRRNSTASRRSSAAMTASSEQTDGFSEDSSQEYRRDGDDDDMFGDDEEESYGPRRSVARPQRDSKRANKMNRRGSAGDSRRSSIASSARSSEKGSGSKKLKSNPVSLLESSFDSVDGEHTDHDEVSDYWKTAIEALELKEQVMAVKRAVENRHDRHAASEKRRGNEKMRDTDGERVRENFRWNPKAPAVSKFAKARSFRESDAEFEALQLLTEPSNSITGTKDICCYDRSKQLVAVRRLRIITVMIECAPTVPRLISSVDPAALSLLIARYAFLNDLGSSSSSSLKQFAANHGASALQSVFSAGTMNKQTVVHDGATGSSSNLHGRSGHATTESAIVEHNADSGLALLHDWAVSALSSCAETGVIFTESGKERTTKSLQSMTAKEKQDLLLAISKSPIFIRLLQLLCGASDLLATHTAFLSTIARATATKNKKKIWTMQRFLADGDAAAEINSIIQSMDPYTCQNIFYPELLPISLLPPSLKSSPSSLTSSSKTSSVCAILGQYENILHDDPRGDGTKPTGRMPTEMDGLPGVRNGALPLRREALITSGAQAFYLDAGTELVIYRSASNILQGRNLDSSREPQSFPNAMPAPSDGLYPYPPQPAYGPPPTSNTGAPAPFPPMPPYMAPPPPPPPMMQSSLSASSTDMPPLGPPTVTVTTATGSYPTQPMLPPAAPGVFTNAHAGAVPAAVPTAGSVIPAAPASSLAGGLTVDLKLPGSVARPQLSHPLHSSSQSSIHIEQQLPPVQETEAPTIAAEATEQRPVSPLPPQEERSEEEIVEEMERDRIREEKVLRSRLRNWNWLPNDLRRRLRVSPIVPVVHAAEAGTASANILTQRLLDDCAKGIATTRPAKSAGDNIGYRAFLKEVVEDAMDVIKAR